jgi:hypothetical protein
LKVVWDWEIVALLFVGVGVAMSMELPIQDFSPNESIDNVNVDKESLQDCL